jgi:orotidine-5'-phosphate decarboxylase
MVDAAERIILALDDPDPSRAKDLSVDLAGLLKTVKVGPVLFNREGPSLIEWFAGRGLAVFLDLKLHDIPNTVAGGIRSACASAPLAFLTVHAAGGPAMVGAAREAIDSLAAGSRPKLVAVTVLTSFSAPDLENVGVKGSLRGQVRRLAKLAVTAGADGIVCSPLEAGFLRKELGEGPLLVVPGIRMPGDPPDDQKRTATPGEAVAAGATHVVVGRPVTKAADPAGAFRGLIGALGNA